MRAIQITQKDMTILRDLLDARSSVVSRDGPHLEMLARELDRADVTHPSDIPSDVITMHSEICIRDLDTGRQEVYELVFPAEADISQNRISVLAPIGTALLGYREGDIIEWPVPGGLRRLKVEDVLFQPEAARLEPARVADPRIAGAAIQRA